MDIIPLYHSSQYGYGCLWKDYRGSREQMHLSEGHGENQHQRLGRRGSCSSAHRLQSGQNSIKLHGFWRCQWTTVTSVMQHLFTACTCADWMLMLYVPCGKIDTREMHEVHGLKYWSPRAALTISPSSLAIMIFIVKLKAQIFWRILIDPNRIWDCKKRNVQLLKTSPYKPEVKVSFNKSSLWMAHLWRTNQAVAVSVTDRPWWTIKRNTTAHLL